MRAAAIGFLLLFGCGSADTAPFTSSGSAIFLYTRAPRYEPLAWVQGGERFPGGATVVLKKRDGTRPLAPNFAASADPAISADGRTILFAGKQGTNDSWQIWETSLEGGDPKRLTNCPEGCVRPFYLPEERWVYAEKKRQRFLIRASSLQGKSLALTYAPGSSLPTEVLRDGRVLFESTFPLGESGVAELYTVYSDGSGVESYRCDHGRVRHSGKQINSGEIVFASENRLKQFNSALATEVQIASPKGDYVGDVAETASGEWLFPWRSGQGEMFRLMWWKPGHRALRPAIEERGLNALQPVVLEDRPLPNRHPSALHDWPFANMLCLNAYTSKYEFKPESIRSMRLYTKDGSGEPHLLGMAPVEADGSFYVQAPGDRPIQIELLDAEGKTLKRERGWFWLRRGEQRACVGCHAGPETAPENAQPMILLKSTNPVDLTGETGHASAGGH